MADHTLQVYNRLPVQFVRGEGAWLYDSEGKKYLDAIAGIAVNGLGTNNPVITKTIQEQAEKIIHVSNLVQIPQQVDLSNLIVEKLGYDARVFFVNSGAEAVETAIKLSRLYGHSKGIAEPKVAAMTTSFHGRTMGTISAADNVKCRTGFDPLLQGFVRVLYNDIQALRYAVMADKDIVAVLIEPIQGEAGLKVPAADYLNKVRELCDEFGLLMMLDEIQSGMGRTGKFFCHEHNNIRPDVITLAKGLANGLPIGACIIRAPYYELFKPGSHGTTFGGNPLSCTLGIATINELYRGKWMENAAKQGQKILDGLKAALKDNKHVKDVRGKGLMIGIELDKESRDILPIALKHGMLFNSAGTHVIRLLPPLIIDDQQTAMIIDQVPKIIAEYYA